MEICHVLEAMGHKQGPIDVKTDNKAVNPFVHASMHIKCSSDNNMDYFSKHYPSAYHRIKCEH
eukprot:8146493-Ditylum_brightwellii.AAC.1